MMHALDLHGAPLVLPREKPNDIWHDLTAFEVCVSIAAHTTRKQAPPHERSGH